MVKQVIKNTKSARVLICAKVNSAADLIVEKLSTFFTPAEMFRLFAFHRALRFIPHHHCHHSSSLAIIRHHSPSFDYSASFATVKHLPSLTFTYSAVSAVVQMHAKITHTAEKDLFDVPPLADLLKYLFHY
jgi:hypothetical protein